MTHSPVAGWLAKVVRAPGRTIGDAAKQLAMLKPVAVKPEPAQWTRAQVCEVVTRLLEHEIGLSITGSRLDATFIQDLGMG